MAKDLEASIKISVDKREGESNLQAFTRAFNQSMRDAGKSAEEIQAFHKLALDIEAGRVAMESLDADMQELMGTYRRLSQVAADKDLLGLKSFQDIQHEIDGTRAAYERLKQSGQLTQAELAQAALKTEDRIRELKAQTNGWAESIAHAKGAFASMAASGAGLVAAAGQAIQFESAMADVAKVVDGTEEQIAALGARIKELATEIPLSADAIAEIAAAGGQLGIPMEQLEAFIELASKMSVAFNMTADEAGQAVAKLSNVFQLPLEKITALGDAINTLGNTTAAKERDIVDVLTRIGGTAAQFGISAEQAAALASTMLSLGMSSEVAGTGINALLSKLQTANVQGKDFKDALTLMGVSAEKLAADIRANPQQALSEFLRTLDALDKQSRAEILTRLFGAEHQDDIARLLGGLAEYEKALARIGDTAQTAGAMQKEFEARLATTEAQIQLLKNGVETIAINLGSTFLPAIRAVVTSLGDAAAGIARFVEMYPGLAATATALGTLAASAAALKTAFLALRLIGVHGVDDIAKAVTGLHKTMGDLVAESGKSAAALKAAGHLAMSGWIGWNIGTGLKEQFLEVELAGIALAEGLTKLAARAHYAWQLLKAPFTDDTMQAAGERLAASLTQIEDDYGALAEAAIAARQPQLDLGQASAQAAAGLETVSSAAAKASTTTELLLDSIRGLDLTKGEGITALVDKLTLLKDQAGKADAAIHELVGKLGAADLAGFAQGIQAAYQDGRLAAEDFARINDQIASASLKALGLAAEEAFGRLTPEVHEAALALQGLEVTLQALPDAPTQKMQALELALGALLAKAKTSADIEVAAAHIERLGEKNALSEEAVTRLNAKLDEQRLKVEQAAPGLQSLAEAYAQFGLKTREAMTASTAEMKAALEVMLAMKAPMADIQQAFMKYAEAAIAANGGVADAALKTQAASLGLTQSLIELEKAAIHASPSMRELNQRFAEAAQAAERHTSAIEKQAQSWVEAAKNALEVAKAKGDANAITEAAIQLAQAEAQAAYAVAQAKAEEARVALEKAQAVELEALADGRVTEAEQQVMEAVRAAAEAKQQAAQQALDAAEARALAAERAAAAEDRAAESTGRVTVVMHQAHQAAEGFALTWQAMAVQAGIAAEDIQRYGAILARAFDQAAERGPYAFNSLADSMRGAVRAAKALDDQIAALEVTSQHSNDALKADILELQGKRQEAARLREESMLREKRLAIELLELEMQRLLLQGKDEEYQKAQIRLRYLKEELELIKQKAELERKAAEERARQEALERQRRESEQRQRESTVSIKLKTEGAGLGSLDRAALDMLARQLAPILTQQAARGLSG
jgi:TP901 family phage tail tape measure protein